LDLTAGSATRSFESLADPANGELIAMTSPRLGTFDVSSTAPPMMRVVMSLLVILLILLLVLGGGGFYAGGPRVGISLGGLILIIIVIMALTGRL
jgi:hypothetical protein